ncbi:protein POOR HOMOLOGOUS SYNAPSIS 1 [Rhododendron vialii]|uniref:protein POOR HOMOLOGOUS SYNAPSIS 1 n=1 Tax=Rhododendron vialii TaxID=182163 RepID=UPI002660083C|nr:protein POOR HOMOLOGOUS SYNAPSIS 1 [Rhododendron vialii]
MAGPLALVLIEHTEKTTISAIGDQWEVQYARFFNYPHPPLSSTHPSLTPLRASARSRVKGNWISSSSSSTASLALTADHTGSGSILAVTLLGKIYEEHYISKLHFSWPHVSCVAGFPTRGTRVVFVTYRDGLGQWFVFLLDAKLQCVPTMSNFHCIFFITLLSTYIVLLCFQSQKFALRFSTSCETETFIYALKEIMGGSRDARLPCSSYVSGISSQSEFVPSDESPYRPKQDWDSVDACTDQMQSGLDNEVAQSTNSQDTELNHDVECISGTSAFPPSFTSLVMSCYSDVEQSRGKFLSEISSQPDCVPSDESPYSIRRPKLAWISGDTFTDQMLSSSNNEVAHNSCSHDTNLKRDTDSILFGSLPPSFTSLVMRCLPVAEQDGAREPVSGDIDLRNQIARCLEDSSFQEMLVKVEKVIGQIGDDMLL